jgi:hypothetical protein
VEEKCAACGTCMLGEYSGICPITRRAKRLLNGPCGVSREDLCEVRTDRQCTWQLMYLRTKEIGQMDRLRKITPPKNWNASLDEGYKAIIHKDHRI